LVAVGCAVALRWPRTGPAFEERLLTAALLALAGGAGLLARLALLRDGDSIAMLLGVLGGAGIAAAVLTVLPVLWRTLVVSLLLLFHLAGLATAVVVVPPPNGAAPYLAIQAWTWVYRPYLQFLHLNNGYHFYAPDPGPSALLWFRVQYADGSARWVRIPDHEKCRNHLETRRLGALCSQAGQTAPMTPQAEEDLVPRRMEAARTQRIPTARTAINTQYREPIVSAKLILSSFARYVARTTPHPTDPAVAVTGVKVYRAEFFNPPAEDVYERRDMLDPTLYQVFYQGDFEPDGRLKESSLKIVTEPDGRVRERLQDPLLYWQIPIVREMVGEEEKVINYVRIHAGDGEEESVP
jgi:hypothetical protein